jgi:hypothetical protein
MEEQCLELSKSELKLEEGDVFAIHLVDHLDSITALKPDGCRRPLKPDGNIFII